MAIPHSLPHPFHGHRHPESGGASRRGSFFPKSQLDRFLMRLRIGYPDVASERLILRNSKRQLSGSRHIPLGA